VDARGPQAWILVHDARIFYFPISPGRPQNHIDFILKRRDGNYYVVSSSRDRAIRIWPVLTTERRRLAGIERFNISRLGYESGFPVRGMDVSCNGKILVASYADFATTFLIRSDRISQLDRVLVDRFDPHYAAMSTDGGLIALADGGDEVVI
jgi:WD40 repeat protein